jgi:SecD/SecF fusion protein
MRVYPFMRYKWWFLGFLSALTVISIIIVFVVGLDLGIDFVGGVRMEVGLEQEASVDDVRSLVSDLGIQDPVVQSVAGASGATGFMITAEEMSQEQSDQVIAALDERFGVKEGSIGIESVGASFGKETTNRAFIAVAIAVFVIIAYLTLRFEIKFALPAIVALVHDVALTLAIYAAGNRLVTYATVAAILTILGYSVHDTIVVFDRMRENTQLMKRETYGQMVDLSIRQTLVRSINTSVALLLPLVAILVFGGPTLKDFALALTIGVITGTYSSMFVAAPLVVIWKECEPRYRKRLVAAATAGQVVVDVPEETDRQIDAVSQRVDAAARTTSKSQKSVQNRSHRPAGKKGGSGKRPTAKDKNRTSR